jgi:hypothetical protein
MGCALPPANLAVSSPFNARSSATTAPCDRKFDIAAIAIEIACGEGQGDEAWLGRGDGGK